MGSLIEKCGKERKRLVKAFAHDDYLSPWSQPKEMSVRLPALRV